jgi:hypothetical protein
MMNNSITESRELEIGLRSERSGANASRNIGTSTRLPFRRQIPFHVNMTTMVSVEAGHNKQPSISRPRASMVTVPSVFVRPSIH